MLYILYVSELYLEKEVQQRFRVVDLSLGWMEKRRLSQKIRRVLHIYLERNEIYVIFFRNMSQFFLNLKRPISGKFTSV